MADRKPKAKKPKGYAKLTQKEKFIAVAKEIEADETGKVLPGSFKAIAEHKSAEKRNR